MVASSHENTKCTCENEDGVRENVQLDCTFCFCRLVFRHDRNEFDNNLHIVDKSLYNSFDVHYYIGDDKRAV